MTSTFAKLASIAVLAATAACTGPYHRHDGAVVEYDVYYDGYYGTYGGGYWGPDGYFYFSDGHGKYRRDDARHFRRDRFKSGLPYRSDRHHRH